MTTTCRSPKSRNTSVSRARACGTAESILTELEEKLGLAARFTELTNRVEQIKDKAEQIRQINHKRAISAELDLLADEIIKLSDRIVE